MRIEPKPLLVATSTVDPAAEAAGTQPHTAVPMTSTTAATAGAAPERTTTPRPGPVSDAGVSPGGAGRLGTFPG